MINNFQIPGILRNSRFWIVLLGVLNIFLLIYLFFGFTTISTSKDSATIYVNGNKFSAVKSVKLRPGIYTIETTTKDTAPTPRRVVALPFIPVTIKLDQIQPIHPFIYARNAPGDANEHTDVSGSFMKDGYWYVGTFTTPDKGSYYTVAIQYVFGEWQIQKIIPSSTILSDDTSMLPDDIAAAFIESARGNDLD